MRPSCIVGTLAAALALAGWTAPRFSGLDPAGAAPFGRPARQSLTQRRFSPFSPL